MYEVHFRRPYKLSKFINKFSLMIENIIFLWWYVTTISLLIIVISHISIGEVFTGIFIYKQDRQFPVWRDFETFADILSGLASGGIEWWSGRDSCCCCWASFLFPAYAGEVELLDISGSFFPLVRLNHSAQVKRQYAVCSNSLRLFDARLFLKTLKILYGWDNNFRHLLCVFEYRIAPLIQEHPSLRHLKRRFFAVGKMRNRLIVNTARTVIKFSFDLFFLEAAVLDQYCWTFAPWLERVYRASDIFEFSSL